MINEYLIKYSNITILGNCKYSNITIIGNCILGPSDYRDSITKSFGINYCRDSITKSFGINYCDNLRLFMIKVVDGWTIYIVQYFIVNLQDTYQLD